MTIKMTESRLRGIIREEILRENRRAPRAHRGGLVALGDIHPALLDESHVRLVLGLRPLALNEGPIDEAHLRRLLREQLLYEGWWDSARDLIGGGIDRVKEKAETAVDAVKQFGSNTKGVVAALWLATSDGKLLQNLTNGARSLMTKGVSMNFIKPLRRIAKKFDGVSDIPGRIVDKIERGFDKFREGLQSGGWKGLLTSMTAYLGYKWAAEEFHSMISDLQEKVEEATSGAAKDLTMDFAKSIADKLTRGLISKLEEKFAEILKSLSAEATAQLAGPVGWIKTAAEILSGVDWVTKNLISVVKRATFGPTGTI